ncbi:MAG: DUF664 domain-containing protein [Bacteroidetes bacterium]|nr:DUF664 domain-containing protein [Bacteroidota bacterium]MBS1974450.1 DUF664 domain-containing protein [Bacteroidota bacterium]
MKIDHHNSRRQFLQSATMAAFCAGTATILPFSSFSNTFLPGEGDINIIRPLEGYSPQIGLFVSMMNWMRDSVIRNVKGLSQTDLDFLMDPKANTIGALLMHLAATDTIYQDLTFFKLGDFSEENKKRFGVAMELGEEARKQIKGNDLDYYLSTLKETREKTLAEFKKRDDKWFQEVDPHFFGNLPTNNFCKWFHVCEHEANHRGQIALIRKRIPGKESKE